VKKPIMIETVMQSEYLQSLAAAKFVQQGLLPQKRHFERLFQDSFVLYAPLNIISGDFYWVGEKHGLKYIVVGDCTGHGISAALLSVLALNLFEYVIMNKGIKKTNKILQEVDKKFIESFKDAEKINFDTPWIDLTVLCIDYENNIIHYSSANRKILHVDKKNNATIFKGSKYPIGGWKIENERYFEANSFKFSKNDSVYIGSDGFQDQIGGDRNKKYSSKRLHNFLTGISQLPCQLQAEKLAIEFAKWKKKNEQVDDICIAGLRL
jgi:serine phosphatase RsbU (regulator of sigma subunit)